MDDILVSKNSTAAAHVEEREREATNWDELEFGRMRGNWVVNGYLGALFAVAAVVHILSAMGWK